MATRGTEDTRFGKGDGWPQEAQKTQDLGKAMDGHKRHKRHKMRDEKKIRELCDSVRGTAFALHSYLRHGHLEKVYENGLAHRLRGKGLKVDQQKPLQVVDEDGTVLGDFFADLYIEDCLIVELKACKTLANQHIAQVLGYLRASECCDALLINFGSPQFQIKKLVL